MKIFFRPFEGHYILHLDDRGQSNDPKDFESLRYLSNDEKGVGLDLHRQNLNSMSPNIPYDYDNLFHRTIEQFAMNFVVFLYHF